MAKRESSPGITWYIDAKEPICEKLLFLSPIRSRKGAYPPKTRHGERRYFKSGPILDYLRFLKGHINIVPSRCISSSRKNYSAEPSTKSHEIVKQDPLQHHDYFNVRDLVKMDDLFRYRVHLGHTYGCRNEYMTPYLFGSRLGTDIIDLEQTLPLFQDALNFTAHVAYKEGIILLLNRSLEMMPWVEKTAKEVGEYAHCRYWKGGLFTDSTKFFGTMTRLPDVGIFFNTLNSVVTQHKAITDHAKLLIPTIGIVDTNADPRLVTYPIPGNDDSKETQLYYLKLFREAILRGKAKRREDQAQA